MPNDVRYIVAVIDGRWYVKQNGEEVSDKGIPVLVWDLDTTDAPLVAEGFIEEVDLAHIEALIKTSSERDIPPRRDKGV